MAAARAVAGGRARRGVLRTGLLLVCGWLLALAGCVRAQDTGEAVAKTGRSEAAQGAAAAGAEAGARPRRFLALGDSYTIGESVAPEQRWPELLVAALGRRGLSVAQPQIIARTGWTTDDLDRAMSASTLTPPYDLVTLLIGVNDQFQGYQEPEYPQRFRALLLRALELAGGRREHVLVVSIPDYSVTPFGQRFDPAAIRGALERYNETNRKIAVELGVRQCDITPLSRGAAENPALLAADGLHPSAEMYRGWVELLLPLAERALRAPEDATRRIQ